MYVLENLERLLNVKNVGQTLKQKKYKQSNRQYLYTDFKVFFVMAVSIDKEVDKLFPEETTVEMDEPSETEAPAVVNLTARSVPKYMPKPGSKSTIWEYFSYKQDDDGKLIEDDGFFCNICHRSVSAKSRYTSNLMSHLKNSHKSVHAQLKTAKTSSRTAAKQSPPKQRSIETSFGLVQPC